MKGPLPLGEEHRRCRWEQTKPKRNTCTNQTDTDQGIGMGWQAMEELGGKGDHGKPCDGEDRESSDNACGGKWLHLHDDEGWMMT